MKSTYVHVDIPSICSIKHACTGCLTDAKFCCASYEICLSEAEVDRAMVWMPEAARYAPHLVSNDGYANVFDDLDDGLFSMDTTDEGHCVFAYAKGKSLLCSLHTVALAHGLALKDIKPLSCLLWPLSVSEGKHKTISVQDNAFDFPCNRKRRKKKMSLSSSVVEIFDTVFGKPSRLVVERAAREGKTQVRIHNPGME